MRTSAHASLHMRVIACTQRYVIIHIQGRLWLQVVAKAGFRSASAAPMGRTRSERKQRPALCARPVYPVCVRSVLVVAYLRVHALCIFECERESV